MSIRSCLIIAVSWLNVVALVACGTVNAIDPLQSPAQTPSLTPAATNTQSPAQTAPPQLPGAATATQTPIVLPTATIGGAPQPNVVATAQTQVVRPSQPTAKLPPSATPLPTPTLDLTEVFGPKKTPNTRATSVAVILTITALAASPTYPPTSTPRPQRTPIIVGAASGKKIVPTTEPLKSGVKLVSKSANAQPGGAAALSIKTAPDTICALQILRTGADGDTQIEPIAGSARQSAGRDGAIAWIWTVDADEPVGSMTVQVNCGDVGVQTFVIEVAR
jgi:hypothetical protein